MAARSEVDTKRIQYLLGLCSQADRERFESEYFEDEDAYQKMLTAEDDLIDAYARGELTGEERRRFEKRFLGSFEGRKRVKFARAFSGGVSARETTAPVTLPGWRGAQRIALIAAVIVVAVVVSWLVIANRRMSRELRELRAVRVESSNEADELRRAADADRARAAELESHLNALQAQSNEPKQHNNTTHNQRVNRLPIPKVKTVSGTVAVGSPEIPVNRDDATLGNTFESKRITQLPLEARDIPSLLTLQTGTTREGAVSGGRRDQSNITLDGVDLIQEHTENFRIVITQRKIDLDATKTPGWVSLRLVLDGPARHTEYRITLETPDGRQVMAVDWVEPLTEDQNSIDTPVIKTTDLPSGNYQLALMGKEPDGSFVRVAQYLLRVSRNQ